MEKILIVDDEKKICNILTQILTDEGFSVEAVQTGEDAIKAAAVFDPDLILMDQNMPGIDGIEASSRIRHQRTGQVIIILTAYGSIPQAVDAMKKGVYDYISKPFDNDELLLVVNRALEYSGMNRELSLLKSQLQDKYSFESIVGGSAVMQRLFEQMKLVCGTDATVLLQGESGTGKELVARAIHFNSERKDKPFVAVNCGAVPVNLIESEFFGHEKGAFTDAKERQTGKFEQAHTGTILLDEIYELPLDAQVKLLRTLEEKTITRLGGKGSIDVDVRIIASTNQRLDEAVNTGRIRNDLFFRLNIFTIELPPLRDRKEDLPALLEHCIRKHNKKLGLNVKSVSSEAMDIINGYDWPGNVRDLENAVQSAMILAKQGVLDAVHLPMRIKGFPDTKSGSDLIDSGLELYMKGFTSKVEKEIIQKFLRKNDNNRTLTAEALKISRKTLFNKMKAYGIEVEGADDDGV